MINGLHCPIKTSAKYFFSVEISRPKVKKMEAVNPYITPLSRVKTSKIILGTSGHELTKFCTKVALLAKLKIMTKNYGFDGQK